MFPISIIIFLAGVGVLGDYFIKLSGNGSKYILYQPFFIGMILYALTAVGWFYVMKHIKLGPLGIFYSVTTVILLALVGTIFFKEHLNIYEIVGIVLGIISIIILARFG
jgi:multidrug transporter EmrE-like cation transporter